MASILSSLKTARSPLSKILLNNATQHLNQMLTQAMSFQQNQPEACAEPPSRGLVIGINFDKDDSMDPGRLTPAGVLYNETKTAGRLLEVLKMSGPLPTCGESRILFAVETEKIPYYSVVAVVGLGKECLGFDSFEMIDENKETIRRSVANACIKLSKLRTEKIDIDPCGHAESAAEGAALGIWQYQALKQSKNRTDLPLLDMYTHQNEDCDLEGWRIGLQKAEAQNLCRELQEMPANHLTPTTFAEKVIQVLCRTGVNVDVKTESWCENEQMNGFLLVGRASCETPIFLQLSYNNGPQDESPIVLIGQGVTYDSGGLCLKDDYDLRIMRGSMTGAAVVVATCKAISALRLPINIRALIPLCENVLGCNAFRPGDAIKCKNGMSVAIQSTDNDDALVLADALYYAQNYCPKFIVDVSTTSFQLRQALDEAASAVYTNSEVLWQKIRNASIHTGDRVWRMPLWKYYERMITGSSISSDVQNVGLGGSVAGPCKIAAFLHKFVPCGQWLHIDAANTMYTKGFDFEYLQRGMSGRPTRTLIEFVAQTICRNTAPKVKSGKDEPEKS